MEGLSGDTTPPAGLDLLIADVPVKSHPGHPTRGCIPRGVHPCTGYALQARDEHNASRRALVRGEKRVGAAFDTSNRSIFESQSPHKTVNLARNPNVKSFY